MLYSTCGADWSWHVMRTEFKCHWWWLIQDLYVICCLIASALTDSSVLHFIMPHKHRGSLRIVYQGQKFWDGRVFLKKNLRKDDETSLARQVWLHKACAGASLRQGRTLFFRRSLWRGPKPLQCAESSQVFLRFFVYIYDYKYVHSYVHHVYVFHVYFHVLFKLYMYI